ncbi:DUF4259 domain-containing protein [Kitasatospora sp. NPDC048365]|uniref:DUF4259 domain-containing protein n=1 Tax=Kitasatospora sp. NPDC048365 TaxID=3364050 RepID=UPI003723492A
MGTWDIGPFDNDTAADFAGDLDDAPIGEREALVRRILKRAADSADHLDQSDGERAVAAAALIAAQHGGEPTCPFHGPSEPLPTFSADLTLLAVDALDQVVAEHSDLVEGWFEFATYQRWRQGIRTLRGLLAPPIPPQEDALFDL